MRCSSFVADSTLFCAYCCNRSLTFPSRESISFRFSAEISSVVCMGSHLGGHSSVPFIFPLYPTHLVYRQIQTYGSKIPVHDVYLVLSPFRLSRLCCMQF